jgi:hypothetical protein
MMSAFARLADSSQTSRHVRNVPGAGINVKDHEVRYSTRNCGGVGLTINWASTGRIAIS